MKRKFLHDISANSLQVIITQICGVIIFYILSIYFSKDEFGEINFALAVLLAAFTILSLGIDQVMVQKIAAGTKPQKILSIYFFHVITTGLILYLLLLLIALIFPLFQQNYRLVLLFGMGKLMIFFASPFKQLANGLEKFRVLFIMSICAIVIKTLAILYLVIFSTINLTLVVIIFIIGDFTELLLSYFITKKTLKISFDNQWTFKNYFHLVKESLPQAGVVVSTSVIARFDWIFLGIIASNIALAEYSFAYKVFEVATLPLLAIAPLLVPRFTRLFQGDKIDERKINDLLGLLRLEIIAACTIALILNILWVPVIDYLTQGKYGFVNQFTILILSVCMPFIYANNFLWSVHFSQGRLKMIFYIFFVCFLVNIGANVLLIPFFQGEGAAFAYLITILIQFILFSRKTFFIKLKHNLMLAACPALALISGSISYYAFNNAGWQLITALFIFFLFLYLSKLISKKDWSVFRRTLQI